jgi:hypothetical protein
MIRTQYQQQQNPPGTNLRDFFRLFFCVLHCFRHERRRRLISSDSIVCGRYHSAHPWAAAKGTCAWYVHTSPQLIFFLCYKLFELSSKRVDVSVPVFATCVVCVCVCVCVCVVRFLSLSLFTYLSVHPLSLLLYSQPL